MTTLFISDLHLSPSTPEINACFRKFMREEAIHAEALYVLGDLFEFWIGDDDKSDFASTVREEFKRLTENGVPVFFTQGNRDFLVGKRFAKQTGVTLLGDETTIDLYGRKAVVLHGDTLCTRDVNYLKYREKVHQPWLQWVFNRIPMFIKKKIVSKVQSDIKDDKQTKSLEIMDVTQSEVARVMAAHGVDLMIHGHTHRPMVHTFDRSGTTNTRIVLGDWYTQGSVLSYDKESFELQTRPFSTD
ncbi:UDP-2,3-diacylglucosamine diphosphatase [Vibrio sp. 16]|uniref:UDP-2,3-diacylglucosamine diphosphatase n=1 Tax=Vibrio sp. 16 TaxID=391586 RepID=UPI002FF32E6A